MANSAQYLQLIDTVTYRRAKDQGTPTGEWMADLVSENPWFKDLLPNVGQPREIYYVG